MASKVYSKSNMIKENNVQFRFMFTSGNNCNKQLYCYCTVLNSVYYIVLYIILTKAYLHIHILVAAHTYILFYSPSHQVLQFICLTVGDIIDVNWSRIDVHHYVHA